MERHFFSYEMEVEHEKNDDEAQSQISLLRIPALMTCLSQGRICSASTLKSFGEFFRSKLSLFQINPRILIALFCGATWEWIGTLGQRHGEGQGYEDAAAAMRDALLWRIDQGQGTTLRRRKGERVNR